MTPEQQRAIEDVLMIARIFSEGLGVEQRKLGDNRGQVVEYFLKQCYLTYDPPNQKASYPWCMAFVCTTLKLALGTKMPLPMSAGCQWMYSWATTKGTLKAPCLFDDPEVGDIFLQWHPELKPPRYAHTGFVRSGLVLDPKDNRIKFGTTEGNTNNDGSREGWGVFLKTRPKGDKMKFLRWINLLGK